MTPTLQVEDLTPFDARSKTEDRWLSQLQAQLRAEDFVIRLGDAAQPEEDFIVSRDARGQWWAGRYIGEIAYAGRRIEIAPRFGTEVVGRWLEGALNLVAVPETAEREPSESFIALLLAAVWAREVERASRHGPPAFRRDHTHKGLFVRGRLDVRETTRLRAHGSAHVASVRRHRDLDNDVTRTLVLAERALQELIGHRHWHTPRVKEVLPQLIAAVGARPRLPSERALLRIRYTPITRPFKEAAWLSWHIARREGFGAQSEAGDSEGILLDVAELWELFLLHCVRLAAPDLSVEHGTTAIDNPFLLSRVVEPSFGMGKLSCPGWRGLGVEGGRSSASNGMG